MIFKNFVNLGSCVAAMYALFCIAGAAAGAAAGASIVVMVGLLEELVVVVDGALGLMNFGCMYVFKGVVETSLML